MTNFRLAAGVFALLAASPLSAESSKLVLEPTTRWVLDYADERCSLMRAFGEGDQAVRLQIDSFGQRYGFRVLLIGKPIPRSAGATGEIRYRLSPEPVETRRAMTLEGVSNDVPAISFDTIFGPPVDPDQYAEVTEEELTAVRAEFVAGLGAYREKVVHISLQLRGGHTLDLQLGSMKEPIAALETCVDDLYAAWGLDPAQLRALRRWPTPIAATIRSVQRRYPSDMMLSGTNAYVPVRVMVDAEGRPTQCVVQVASVDRAFKEAVCAGLARGFEPALDADGKPVASLYQTAVMFLVNGR